MDKTKQSIRVKRILIALAIMTVLCIAISACLGFIGFVSSETEALEIEKRPELPFSVATIVASAALLFFMLRGSSHRGK